MLSPSLLSLSHSYDAILEAVVGPGLVAVNTCVDMVMREGSKMFITNGKKQKARPKGVNITVSSRAKFALRSRCWDSALRAILVCVGRAKLGTWADGSQARDARRRRVRVGEDGEPSEP